ncbi:AsmA-like protein [Tahibacter aquaticus]|uniref:AsmA-like protein n=1 Tax=Tahibacter aquaticus TaxID=520092 RepID=A0A4R6YR83_9GAMM|nr:AsmA family protein [Tahibacter aquaticus]TDR40460.1 AsmA-like protein [Tahibacter aquaticus]
MRWRRLLKFAALLLLLLAVGLAIAIQYLAQPERVAALLAEQARSRLGLELAFSGTPRYRVWPRLHLQLLDVQLKLPGDTQALLGAQQLDVSLPWSSLRDSRLVIEQLQLVQPRLELAALRRWLDQPGEAAMPDLSLHLLLRGAEILRDGKPVASGLDFDGAIDLHQLRRWWTALAAADSDALVLPPLPGNLRLQRLQLDGVSIEGLRIDSATPP